MIEWRFFDVNDVDWIIDSSKVMFAESEWKEGEYDEQKIRDYLLHVIDNPLSFCGLLGLKDGQRAGFFIGQVGEYVFSKTKFARESEIYVLPAYRGSMVAITMMKKFIEWAKAMKAKELFFEPSTNGKLDKFDAMAKRLGMTITSKTYRKTL